MPSPKVTLCPKCGSPPRPNYCEGISPIVMQPEQPERGACERSGEHLHWVCFCGYQFETDCKDTGGNGNKK